ncbi:DUF5336 domain-containing protein [Mycobacterium asiaticum]|nr:DUF5336 domain-containing protein [Mycobacterium asiaticum]OBK94187.1 hypothetical protein A5645_17135 [Mycobacterium asiaticum]
MAYPSGYEGYYPTDQAWSSGDAKPAHRHLTVAVVLLGLGAYLVSFGPMLNAAGIDWDVRFAVLAGLLAAFGLLPRQTSAPKIVAVLAAIGFLDALSRGIVVPDGIEPGWALWVLIVLNALQTAAAIGAVLTQPSATDEQQAWYAAYAEQYAQAAAQYYGQYAASEQADTGYDGATAHAQQPAQTRPAAAPQEASYAEFVAGQPTAPADQATGQPSQLPTGLPQVGQHAAPAAPPSETGQPQHHTSAPH